MKVQSVFNMLGLQKFAADVMQMTPQQAQQVQMQKDPQSGRWFIPSGAARQYLSPDEADQLSTLQKQSPTGGAAPAPNPGAGGTPVNPAADPFQAAQEGMTQQEAEMNAEGAAGAGSPKTERINQLEQLYHQTWNYFAQNVIPQLNQDTQQAQQLKGLFDEVRPQWKALRAGIQANPQIAESLDDNHISAAEKSLTDAQSALQTLQQSETMNDQHLGYFQQQLQRAFNAINQMVQGGAAQSAQPEGGAAQPAPGAPPAQEPPAQPAQPGLWQQMGNMLKGRRPAAAANGRPILTASMGSAQDIIALLR